MENSCINLLNHKKIACTLYHTGYFALNFNDYLTYFKLSQTPIQKHSIRKNISYRGMSRSCLPVLIFLRQYDLAYAVKGPLDAYGRIIPCYAAFIFRMIKIGAFVAEFCFI